MLSNFLVILVVIYSLSTLKQNSLFSQDSVIRVHFYYLLTIYINKNTSNHINTHFSYNDWIPHFRRSRRLLLRPSWRRKASPRAMGAKCRAATRGIAVAVALAYDADDD